jgi:hypothetical protein
MDVIHAAGTAPVAQHHEAVCCESLLLKFTSPLGVGAPCSSSAVASTLAFFLGGAFPIFDVEITALRVTT